MNRKEIIIILIVTFMAVMVWIIGDILHTRSGVKLSPQLQEASESLDPNFDNSTLVLISQVVSNSQSNTSSSQQFILPTPSPSTTPQASSSATPLSTQSAQLSP